MRATSPSQAASGRAAGKGFMRALALPMPSASARALATRSVSCCKGGLRGNLLCVQCGTRGARACDAAEGGADAHADAGRVAFAEYVAGHHFSCHEEVG